MEANQIAGAIVAFHRDMDVFHRKVRQFNRELQKSLDENLGFESVSRVSVEEGRQLLEARVVGPDSAAFDCGDEQTAHEEPGPVPEPTEDTESVDV